ncbi:type II secretion system protein, partial [Campylobacter peloridis]|uniref:type II secretion system protein n=1 Tax=Campylobacter peloridis TaxID=488546 RepID=UPI001C72FD8B
MKKAFSLLELVLSILIFSIITAILSNPSIQLYDKVFQVKKTNEVFFDLNQILLKIEKIQQDCIEFKYNSHSFECYVSASNDIFYDNSLNRMNFSGVILEDNKSFFSPKSNFYIIENAVLK